MFCPNPSCSVFIDVEVAQLSTGGNLSFFCQACNTAICLQCKSRQHASYVSCADNRAILAATNETAPLRSLGFQQCSKCHHFVELAQGCNHMTCLCRHQFCYQCGADWVPRRCRCDLIDMRQLRLDEDRNIPANVEGAARVEELARRVNEAQRQMFDEELCAHRMVRRDDYSTRSRKPKCRQCNRRLNLFGYKCTAMCGQNLCIGCNLHRR